MLGRRGCKETQDNGTVAGQGEAGELLPVSIHGDPAAQLFSHEDNQVLRDGP